MTDLGCHHEPTPNHSGFQAVGAWSDSVNSTYGFTSPAATGGLGDATCVGADGWDDDDDDCDDTSANSNPVALEICDGQDNDCDGTTPTDEIDNDSDGYVECTLAVSAWTGISGGDDCDDGDATIYDGALELCDGLDNDCDEVLPDDESDLDSDGWVECIEDLGGWDGASITGDEDCDDTDDTVFPGATELCDGLDNDCDGDLAGEESDLDSDGYVECAMDSGGWDGTTVSGYEDCDDDDASISPVGVDDPGHDVDENCSGTLVCYVDSDDDGYGSTSYEESTWTARGGRPTPRGRAGAASRTGTTTTTTTATTRMTGSTPV